MTYVSRREIVITKHKRNTPLWVVNQFAGIHQTPTLEWKRHTRFSIYPLCFTFPWCVVYSLRDFSNLNGGDFLLNYSCVLGMARVPLVSVYIYIYIWFRFRRGAPSETWPEKTWPGWPCRTRWWRRYDCVATLIASRPFLSQYQWRTSVCVCVRVSGYNGENREHTGSSAIKQLTQVINGT